MFERAIGVEMNNRYRGLQLIGQVLKVAGALEMAFGVIALVLVPLVLSGADGALSQLGLPITSPGTGLIIGIVGGIVTLFAGAVTGLLTFALGELINVVIAIEENTRSAKND
jgi:hypothetical protein